MPSATDSAQLVGPLDNALVCLAVLARHVGQGLRDTNLTLAHERDRLRVERAKLIFLSATSLSEALAEGDERLRRETVLFASDLDPRGAAALRELLAQREASGLATFVTSSAPVADLATWRLVDLTA